MTPNDAGGAECFEVVLVTKPSALLDGNLVERSYWRRDGVRLAAGYYVVSWPPRAKKMLFNEDALFRGPFRGRDEAIAEMRRWQARHRRLQSWWDLAMPKRSPSV